MYSGNTLLHVACDGPKCGINDNDQVIEMILNFAVERQLNLDFLFERNDEGMNPVYGHVLRWIKLFN